MLADGRQSCTCLRGTHPDVLPLLVVELPWLGRRSDDFAACGGVLRTICRSRERVGTIHWGLQGLLAPSQRAQGGRRACSLQCVPLFFALWLALAAVAPGEILPPPRLDGFGWKLTLPL